MVYGIIGILALKLALGSGGETTNQQGAMRRLAEQHFGKVLLLLLAAGLAGYAVWRLTRAALGRGPEGSDKGFDRIAALGSGLVYAGLFFAAVQILRGSGGGAGGNAKKTTADAFDLPAGKWLVLLAGIVLIGVGLYQGYRGLTQSFLEDSKTEEMAPEVRDWIARIGTVGHLARFVVFGLIGVFLVKAALDYNARSCGRPRRRPREAPAPDLRPPAPRRRCRRPHLIRALLAERRALPAHLIAPRAAGQPSTRSPCKGPRSRSERLERFGRRTSRWVSGRPS